LRGYIAWVYCVGVLRACVLSECFTCVCYVGVLRWCIA